MTMQGPQKYPGASTADWWQSKWGGDRMESNVIVWHSTEGTGLDDYDNGSQAPNFTAKPDFGKKKLVWYQHFDFDISSRALVHAGSVATNTLNVVQVEIVGTCDPSTHKKWGSTPHLYMPDLPDWAIRDLAAFAKWAHDNHNVPLTSGLTFKAYPSSYGTSNGVRMSNSKWLSFKGHCGHQHVPSGNVHGDPGAFPMNEILTVAKGGTVSHEEDDMAITDADAAKIALKTWSYKSKTNPTGTGAETHDAYWYDRDTHGLVAALTKKVDALTATALTDDQIAKIAAAVAASPALADKIADTIAARLKD